MSVRLCPYDHGAMLFLPGFIEPQTNRLQHVFRDLEVYGIPELLGGPQWAEYKQHTLRRYYREWLLFFQRRPGKVVRCAGLSVSLPINHRHSAKLRRYLISRIPPTPFISGYRRHASPRP